MNTSPSAQKAAGEIKLCPFCGNQSPLPRIGKRRAPKLGHDRYHWYVRHGWCGTEGAHGLTEQQAIDNWNKRDSVQQAITEAVDAAVAPKEKRVKELEAALKYLTDEADREQCPCTLRQRDSGHHIDCNRPRVIDAIEQARSALEAPHEQK